MALVLVSCDENTGTMGIYIDNDQITNSTGSYTLSSRSIAMDSGIVANNTYCYLGRVIDPETDAALEADFAAQYQTFENYRFPEKSRIVDARDTNNIVNAIHCDSVEVRLYFNSYFGKPNNTMKLEVYELSHDKILSEDSTYYTDIDLQQYVPAGSKPVATKVFTPIDYSVNEIDRNSSSYLNNVRVMLPASIGQRMMQSYYSDPTSFRDSYTFIRQVLPGFYFRCSDGSGTMLRMYAGTLNVFFHYRDQIGEGETQRDTIYSAYARFAATPEVIQSTRFTQQGDMTPLLADAGCTYLKTPAGICTELTLPVDEIFGGAHQGDSISMASISLTRYNKDQSNAASLFGTPSELLMVRRADLYRFFQERRVANARTSYIASFNSTYNSYDFNNISRLVSYCHHEKKDGARRQGISEAEWALQNPDWNRVVLVPVSTSSTNATSALGTTTSMLVSVTHDLNLNSVRLVGGNNALKMQVVYSKFSK